MEQLAGGGNQCLATRVRIKSAHLHPQQYRADHRRNLQADKLRARRDFMHCLDQRLQEQWPAVVHTAD